MSKPVDALIRGIAAVATVLWVIAAGCSPPAQRVTPADMSLTRPGATSLVVVHSRSGNTAEVGLALAEVLGADYLRLAVADGLGDGFFSTPNRRKPVAIDPRSVDLSRYQLILLGSPIWYWYPSAAIYSFVSASDFACRPVVLFYTYEGGISDKAVPEWTQLVGSRHGRVIDVFGINRKELGERTPSAAARSWAVEARASWPAAAAGCD